MFLPTLIRWNYLYSVFVLRTWNVLPPIQTTYTFFVDMYFWVCGVCLISTHFCICVRLSALIPITSSMVQIRNCYSRFSFFLYWSLFETIVHRNDIILLMSSLPLFDKRIYLTQFNEIFLILLLKVSCITHLLPYDEVCWIMSLFMRRLTWICWWPPVYILSWLLSPFRCQLDLFNPK